MAQLLDGALALGQAPAQLVLEGAQRGLGGAFGLEGLVELGDGLRLALDALLSLQQALAVQLGAGVLYLSAQVLGPEQHAQGEQQGTAEEDLAQRGHAAAFCAWVPLWRS